MVCLWQKQHAVLLKKQTLDFILVELQGQPAPEMEKRRGEVSPGHAASLKKKDFEVDKIF